MVSWFYEACMKSLWYGTVFAALSLLLFFSCPLSANWGGFDEGMASSAKSGKYAIVDFSTDWCVWCKKMDKETFSNPDVSSRLAREFVTIRINAESDGTIIYKGQKTTPRYFTGMMGVRGFPTLVVFNAKGDPVTQLPSFVDAKTFMLFLDYVKKEKFRVQSFEDYYRTTVK
jgi:thioredoxin-related protein